MMDSLQRDFSSFLSTNGLQYLQRHFPPFLSEKFPQEYGFHYCIYREIFRHFCQTVFLRLKQEYGFLYQKRNFTLFLSNKFPQSAAGIWLPLSIARFSTKFFVKNFPPSVLQEYYGELTFSPLQMGNFLVLFVNYAKSCLRC